MTIEKKLQALNIVLPVPPLAVANYVPFSKLCHVVVVSGQLPMQDGRLAYAGKVGVDFTIEEGQEAAKLCAINILAQLKIACEGDLERVNRCLRLGGFVNCANDFTFQPQVINGASDLMVAVFGDKGRHARAAVGVNALPLSAAVEVEALFELS